jgi:hypothetical protein
LKRSHFPSRRFYLYYGKNSFWLFFWQKHYADRQHYFLSIFLCFCQKNTCPLFLIQKSVVRQLILSVILNDCSHCLVGKIHFIDVRGAKINKTIEAHKGAAILARWSNAEPGGAGGFASC